MTATATYYVVPGVSAALSLLERVAADTRLRLLPSTCLVVAVDLVENVPPRAFSAIEAASRLGNPLGETTRAIDALVRVGVASRVDETRFLITTKGRVS